MSEEVIDALLVKLGVTVDQESFDDSAQAINDLDSAINKAARDRGKTGLDRIGKNMADTGAGARALEQGVDKFDKTINRVPRSVNVLQTRLGSATQQMASFRKETQSVVSLLSRGAAATGLGPLSGSLFSMLTGAGPLAMAAAGVGGLAANAFAYTNGALSTEVNSSTYGVSKSDFQNFNRFGKKITGEDDVGTQILQAAQRIKVGSAVGNIPVDIARYGGSPADFADAFRRPTMDVVDTIQKQLARTNDPLMKQGIGNALGLSQSSIMALGQDYRTGIRQADRPGSTYSDQDVANARKFEDSLVNLITDFDRLKITLGQDVIPSLDNFVKRVDGFFSEGGGASKYLDAFNKLSKGDVKGFVDSFGKAEQSTQVITPEQNNAMTKWLMDNVPFDKLAHYTYDGAANGWQKDGLRGAIKGAKDGFNASPVVANPWLDGMTAETWESTKQAVYARMPSAHIDDDVSKPLRPEYQPKQPTTQPSGPQVDDQTAAQQRAIQYFTQNGYSHAQAFGIVANLTRESGMSTGAVGDNGQAYGLAQWHPDRQQSFKDFFGKDIRQSTEKDQLDFINYELQNSEKRAGLALSNTKTASEAADVFRRMYERPAEDASDAAKRIQLAQRLSDSKLGEKADVQELDRKVPVLINQPPAAAPAAAVSYQMLPSGTPETYNMVANPPAPPTVDATQAQPASSDGNVVHIDARGSTDVHKITSEAMRAASDHFQGQMTVAMSHLSTDLDQ
ncbi:phage tail tip lysozyme [Pseudomonas silvicola]|nr:phage tail tip lysozyme [Pseudomonas silvicola]